MTAGGNRKWAGVTGGGSLGQQALLVLLHYCNVTVGYVLLAFAVPFYMLFARKGYLAIYRYFRLRHGFGPMRSFVMTYLNHFRFGQCMLDRFAVYAGRRNFFKVEIEGEENFLTLSAGERGFIIASSHVGNFELGGYLLRNGSKRINALVFGGESARVMENRQRVFDRNNISVIPVTGDMSHVFGINRALSEGEIVSMPCDRMFGSAKSIGCELLGTVADFPAGPFSVAVQFDVPVLTVFVMKEGVARYRAYVGLLKPEGYDAAGKRERVELLAREFASRLDGMLRRYPEQWFNFYDFWRD